jgi:minor extracellular serine protease Vpr
VKRENGHGVAALARARRVSTLGVATIVAASMLLGAQPALAQDEEEDAPAPFTRLDLKSLGLAGTFRPASLGRDRRINVIVRLDGASVGQRAAAASRQGTSLTRAQKARVRAALVERQRGVASRIRALGGRILFRYQDAYNGIAASVRARDVAAVRRLPGVAAVYASRVFERDNTVSVQYTGGNAAWNDTGKTGLGVKVAILDTGVDYYHANFGGADGAARFAADDSTIIEPGTFPTPKVANGRDFVGDDYDASGDPAERTPHPDPDPLDCNGHGSHVAGSAAGFGVLSSGATYSGPYDSTTYSNSFTVGPGVAPRATVLAYRIFGCAGSVSEEVLVAALDQAFLDGADVLNMSLGSPFGRTDEPSAAASDTLAENGVVVVASAGNAGAGAYIVGAPAIATRALAVAAIDTSSPTFPGASITLNVGGTVQAQVSNGSFQGDPGPALPSGSLDIAVLRTSYPAGPVSLGCDPADFSGYPGGVSGKLVVVLRGVCARVHKAIEGQKAGAAAVAMIDTTSGYPPFEGTVTSDPDTGEPFDLTIPFFGVRGLLGPAATDDGDRLVAAATATSFTATTVPNPGYQRAAGFTSGGPRNVDSAVKPEVIAPGVSIKSTASGTGTAGTRISGTSMAAPHTAGLAALVTEAHPTWATEAIKAAIIDTTDSGTSKILGYNVRTAGAGVVNARRAVDTVAYATTSGGGNTLSFGYQALAAAGSQTLPLTLHNTSGSSITYDLSVAANGGQLGAVVSVAPSSVTVAADATATVGVTINLNAAAVAALPAALSSNFGAVQTVRGAIMATPTTAGAGIYSLQVPYILVPRGLSNVAAGPRSAYSAPSEGRVTATVPLSNSGIHAGVADVYAWGIHDADDTVGSEDSLDIRDVGVQVQSREYLCGGAPAGACGTANDRSLVFAINTYGQWSNASVNEFDIAIDLQNDGRPDYFVVGVDLGAVLAGAFNGQFASFIFDADSNLIDAWVSLAPMNGSTLLLPTLASEIGLDPAVNSTRFHYAVASFGIIPGGLVDGTRAGTFRSHQPPVSTGQQFALAPGGTATLNVWVDRGKFSGARQLGWLVVAQDDANGGSQADQVPVGTP